MKTMLNQKGFSPIVILLGIVLFLVLMGGAYYLGTLKSSVPANEAKGNKLENVPKISPSSIPVESSKPASDTNQSTCKENFTHYENEYFSICYPNNLAFYKIDKFDIGNPGGKSATVEFKNEKEQLRIFTFFQGGWGQQNECFKTEKVEVFGFKAERMLWVEQLANDKCGNYTSLGTMASGNGVGPFYIELSSAIIDSKDYYADLKTYEEIEKSLRIKKSIIN